MAKVKRCPKCQVNDDPECLRCSYDAMPMTVKSCRAHEGDFRASCPDCVNTTRMWLGIAPIDYGKVAAAAFQSNLDCERMSLRASLAPDKWQPFAQDNFSACPVCGASVHPHLTTFHTEWHVRCLQ